MRRPCRCAPEQSSSPVTGSARMHTSVPQRTRPVPSSVRDPRGEAKRIGEGTALACTLPVECSTLSSMLEEAAPLQALVPAKYHDMR